MPLGLNLHTGDAKAYTPIGPGEEGRHAARPLYYGIRCSRRPRAARCYCRPVSQRPISTLTAYATRAGDGELRVCLINKEFEKAARVTIETGRPFGSASILRLTASSVHATDGVSLGGSSVDDFGRWMPEQREMLQWRGGAFVEVPAASAALVNFSGR